MEYPLISIVTATYNSQATLEKTLKSIANQTYPKEKIEVLIIDGGSTDNTKSIAKTYDCKILNNPKVDPVSAKYIGILKSLGKYILFLDSDEVLEKPTSLENKYLAFTKNSKIKSVIPNGYKTPIGGSPINHYINEFGDPFSYFIYNESKGSKYLLKDWSFKYKKIFEDKDIVTFIFSNNEQLPLLELSAGGCMVDLQYLKTTFPEINNTPSLITHIFYLLNSKSTYLAVTKNDSTIHFSSDTLSKYLKKISSRIKNNIFNTEVGWVGFRGREKFQPFSLNIRKYLFIPYSFSLLLPIIDSLNLSLTRKEIIYLLHTPLCLYTSLMIIYFLIISKLGIKPDIRVYGK